MLFYPYFKWLVSCSVATLLCVGCASKNELGSHNKGNLSLGYPFSTDIAIGADAFVPAGGMKTDTSGDCSGISVSIVVVNSEEGAELIIFLAGNTTESEHFKRTEIINTQIRCTTQTSGHVATITFLTRSTDGPEIMVFDTREKRIFLK